MAALFRIEDVRASLEFAPVGSGTEFVRILMASASDVALLDASGGLHVMGGVNGLGGSAVTGLLTEPTPVAGGPWVDVAGSSSGTSTQVILLHADGTLWGYGFSAGGMFGQGVSSSSFPYLSPLNLGNDWARVWCSQTGVYGAKTNGTLWSWGYGYLGNNTAQTQRNAPTLTSFPTATWVGFSRNLCALTDTGAVYSVGRASGHGFSSTGEVRTVAQLTSLPPIQYLGGRQVAFAPDYKAVFAIATDGALYGWGFNERGELSPSVPEETQQRTPLLLNAGPWAFVQPSSAFHTCGLRSNGDLYIWGQDPAGEYQIGAGHVWLAADTMDYVVLALRDLAPPPPSAFWTNFRKTFETP